MKRLLLSFLVGAMLASAQTSSGIVSSGITASGALNVPMSGLQARYEVGSLTGSQGTLVGTWPDTSGNGYNATQATTGNKPFLNYNTVTGQPSVEFIGNNALGGNAQSLTNLVIPNGLTTSSQSQSMIAIWEPTLSVPSVSETLFNLGAATARVQFGYTSVLNIGVTTEADTRSLPGGPQMTGFVSNASNAWTVIGSALSSPLTALTSNTTTGGVIGCKNGSNNCISGNLFALFVYNRALAQGDLNQIYVYAQQLYGVQPLSTQKLIAVTGDSQSSNYPGALYNWMDWTQQYKIANPTYTMYNFALAATTTSQLATYPPDAVYSAIPTKAICVVWSGNNDNANNSGGGSAWLATALTNLANFTTARRAAGWKVVGATMIPRAGAPSNMNANYEAQRQTFNSTYRANAGNIYWDALADVGNDATIGQAGDNANATYYYTDETHLIQAGMAIAEGYFTTAIGSL